MTDVLLIKNLLIQRGDEKSQFSVQLPGLSLASGDLLAITGESGCGKSTLLEVIALLLQPKSVDVFQLNGRDVSPFSSVLNKGDISAIRSRDIGFVVQNGGLLPYLSVAENIVLSRRLLGLADDKHYVDEIIRKLKISHLLNRKPSALSIGERQRVLCARAIAHQPSLLLADEPTSALDPYSARRLMELFLGAVRDLGMAVLLVSHDWGLLDEFGLGKLEAYSTRQGAVFEKH